MKEEFIYNCGGIEPIPMMPIPDDKDTHKTSKNGNGVKDIADEAKHHKAAKK